MCATRRWRPFADGFYELWLTLDVLKSNNFLAIFVEGHEETLLQVTIA